MAPGGSCEPGCRREKRPRGGKGTFLEGFQLAVCPEPRHVAMFHSKRGGGVVSTLVGIVPAERVLLGAVMVSRTQMSFPAATAQRPRSGAEPGSAHQSIQWKVHQNLGWPIHSVTHRTLVRRQERKPRPFLSLPRLPHLHALTFLLCTPAMLAHEVLLTGPQRALLRAPTEPLLP